MKGTANITTRTTVTPVTVTEIKNGTVAVQTGMSIIVRTDEGIKSFTQSDVDKRGVKIVRNGKVAQISDFRQGDQLSATIITSLPPTVVTEKEVQATLASAGGARRGSRGAAGSGSAGRRGEPSAAPAPVPASAARRRADAAEDGQLVAVARTLAGALPPMGLALTLGAVRQISDPGPRSRRRSRPSLQRDGDWNGRPARASRTAISRSDASRRFTT